MKVRGSLLGAVLVTAVLAGCGREAPHGHSPTEGETRCEAGFTTPEGFEPTETLEDPYPDHVGIRLGFRSDDGRELHYFAGIPGEFGEGLPDAGRVEVALGLDGPLQGSDRVWVLSWRAPGPCGVRAVLGSGFTRTEFIETLERAAIVPTQ